MSNTKNELPVGERTDEIVGNHYIAEGRSKTKLTVALLLLPWLAIAGLPIISALSDISASLNVPENTVKLVITLPNLSMIISCLLGGVVVGRRLSYKMHIIIPSIIMIVTGTAPFFVNSFTMLLVMRALFGLGIGFLSPLNADIVFKLYPEEERAKIIGISSASMFASSILYTLLGGYFGGFGWHYVFLIHLIAVVPMIIVLLLLPNISLDKVDSSKAAVAKEGLWSRLPPKSFYFILVGFVFQMLTFPMVVNVSFILSELNIESPATSSIVLTINTITSSIAGLAVGFAVRALRRFVLPLALAFSAVGMLVASMANGLTPLLVGSGLSGVGSSIMGTAVMLEVAYYVRKEHIGLFSGVNMAASCIGGFCMTAYTGLLANLGLTSSRSPLLVSAIGVAVMLLGFVAFILISMRLRNRETA
ncbi:MAG: MFS transporter [Oscillospiraceae bacterium]|nr:MFS transporter [Oscillospiraceae bacterium]